MEADHDAADKEKIDDEDSRLKLCIPFLEWADCELCTTCVFSVGMMYTIDSVLGLD